MIGLQYVYFFVYICIKKNICIDVVIRFALDIVRGIICYHYIHDHILFFTLKTVVKYWKFSKSWFQLVNKCNNWEVCMQYEWPQHIVMLLVFRFFFCLIKAKIYLLLKINWIMSYVKKCTLYLIQCPIQQ